MKEIFFVTGNANKYREAKSIYPELKQLNLELPEIQSLDCRHIIERKLQEAMRIKLGLQLLVDDTALHLDCLGGLPGPLIKWFLEALKDRGIFEAARALGNTKALATTVVGYAKSSQEILFSQGIMSGRLVEPRGASFGWDNIFLPDDHSKTYGEMTTEEKMQISPRAQALRGLKLAF
ncbi:MAG: non-canonical purine NTP pyrophosphatase [Proteobacteria bacterium]|nr:MAG: non-canonical purine NTP pyrophosphatase [Pseudomonadota bacterium]